MAPAGVKKRSMAERLAALANPTPEDVDIEDMPDGARVGRKSRAEDESEDEVEYDDYSGFVAQRSSLRQNLGLNVVDDPKYRGVRASRKDLMGEDDETQDEDEGEGEGGGFSDEEGGSDGSEEDEEDEEITFGPQLRAGAGDASEEEESGEDMSGEEYDDEGSGGDESGSDEEEGEEEIDEEEQRLREELEQIQNEEESGGISHFSASKVSDEVAKGTHTRHQLSLYDSLMETRIRLQQSVNIANKFAQHDVRPLFMLRGGDEMAAAVEAAVGEATGLLDDLLELQEACLRTSAEEPIRTGAQKRKRPHTSEPTVYWKYIKTVQDDFSPYRNATLTKWHNKTTLASGGLSMTKQLKAINQGIMQQVEHMLADADKLVQRTQLKRIALRPMGKVDKTGGDKDFGEEIDKSANEENYDAEIFDDNDMYHQLLRDLISARSRFSEGDDPTDMARAWLEVQKLRTKVKKKVDTKASKGRKIRYTVMNELVNFMFPVEKGTSDDATRTELCRSLFSAV